MRSAAVIGVSALALLSVLNSSAARGAVVTQTVTFSEQTLLLSNGTEANFGTVPIVASFSAFDGASGTLTAVSFAANYDFVQVASIGPSGSNINSSANGPFRANNAIIGGSGNGANVQGSPNTTAKSPFPVTGSVTIPADMVANYSSTSGGMNTFTYDATIRINLSAPSSQSASVVLSNTSSVTVTYTFTPAPEPTGLSVIGIATAAGLLRRRR